MRPAPLVLASVFPRLHRSRLLPLLLLMSLAATEPAAAVPPTFTKQVRGCIPMMPCRGFLLAAPAVKTMTYDVVIVNRETFPVTWQFTDDIPANALAFRVIDRGDGSPCGSVGGPICSNVPAPGGANGTGRVVIDGLSTTGGGASARRSISYEVDFSCPPSARADMIYNQAKLYSPGRPGLCAPCLSDDPITDPVGDPTGFWVGCMPPPGITVTKTPNVAVWRPGDPRTISYKIEMTNDSSTDPVPSWQLQINDRLPYVGNGFPAFDTAATCPIQVTSIPPATLKVDNIGCDRINSPYIVIRDIPDIPPLGKVELDLSVVMLDGLADQTEFCNKAIVDYWASTTTVAGCTTIVWPQVVDFRTSVKTVTPETVSAGQPLSYALLIKNTGSAAATGVMVTDVFDACVDASAFDVTKVTVAPGPPPAPPSYDAPSRTLSIPLGTLAPGLPTVVSIPGLLGGTEPVCCNQATITADQLPAPGQPTGSTGGSGTRTCTGPRTVDFTRSIKAVAPAPATAGAPITYTLTVTNSGATTANHVLVSDFLPACVDDSQFDPATGVTASPIAPGAVNYTRSARLLEVELLTLPAQAIETITIAGLRAGPATADCCNQAQVSSDEVAFPGDATGQTPGAGDPTCVRIDARLGCNLNRAVYALGGPRTPPWVYTNSCSVPERLPGPPLVTGVLSDAVIDVTGGSSTAELSLYELDCPCTDVIRLWRDAGTSPPSVRLRF